MRCIESYDDQVLLDISTACGARCVYCLHQRRRMVKPQLMANTTFMKIADLLACEKFKFVYLYMSGEPFLHPDLPEFIVAIAERGMDSSVATKLFLPINFERIDEALNRCDLTGRYVEFLITIDSLKQETVHKIAPGISATKVWDNVVEMAKLRDRHNSAVFTFNTVVNRINEWELDEIKFALANLGFTAWAVKQMGYYMPYEASEEDIATIGKFLPRNPQYSTRFYIEGNKLISRMKDCDLGPPAIIPNGDVTICCHDMLHKLRIGNVLQQGSIRRILASEQFQRTAAAGRRMQLDICRGCN